jgi:hypothetical protein
VSQFQPARHFRVPGLLLALSAIAGCASDSPTTPNEAALPVTPAGSLFTNTHEPGSLTPIATQAMSGGTVSGWSTLPSTVRILTDASGLLSPNGYGRMTYPKGFSGGRAPGTTSSANFSSRKYKEIYVRAAVRMSSNFYGHPSATNKVLHFWSYNPQHNRVFLSFEGKGTGTLNLQVRCQGTVNDSKCAHLGGNQGASAAIKRGVWNVIEVRLRMNSMGQSNGVVEAWVNGVRTHYYTNIRLDAGGWGIVSWSPTWGGVGSTVPAAQTMDLEHLYVSGRQ